MHSDECYLSLLYIIYIDLSSDILILRVHTQYIKSVIPWSDAAAVIASLRLWQQDVCKCIVGAISYGSFSYL